MINLGEDRAFWIGLITALHKLKGHDYVDTLTQLLSSMKPHQKDRWRKVLCDKKMKYLKQVDDSNDPPLKHSMYVGEILKENSLGKNRVRVAVGAEKNKDSKLEYDSNDPRLQHLCYVAEMVKEKGVDQTIAFLTANDFVFEHSAADRFLKKFDDFKKEGRDLLSIAKYKILLGDGYDKVIDDNPGANIEEITNILDASVDAKNAATKNELIHARKHRVSPDNRNILVVIVGLTVAFLIAIAAIQYFK